MKKYILFFVLGLTVFACQINYVVTYTGDNVVQSKDLNVCKQLKDSAIIYAVFVDAKNFHSILVRREDDAIRVRAMLNNFGLKMHLNIQPHMFVG